MDWKEKKKERKRTATIIVLVTGYYTWQRWNTSTLLQLAEDNNVKKEKRPTEWSYVIYYALLDITMKFASIYSIQQRINYDSHHNLQWDWCFSHRAFLSMVTACSFVISSTHYCYQAYRFGKFIYVISAWREWRFMHVCIGRKHVGAQWKDNS